MLAYPRYGQVEIVPNVWLGCFASSLDHTFLAQEGIGLVVNMTESTTPMKERLEGITYLRFPMDDTRILNEEMAAKYHRLFNGAATAIQRYRTEYPDRKVLVHCMAGINRSATALGYYLMIHHGKPFDEVFSLLTAKNRQHRRMDCLTNKDFRSMLRGLESNFGMLVVHEANLRSTNVSLM